MLVFYDVSDFVGGAFAELALKQPLLRAVPTLEDVFAKGTKPTEPSELENAVAEKLARDETLDLARFVLARLVPKPEATEYQLEVRRPGSVLFVAKPELQKRFEAFLVGQRMTTQVVDMQVRYVEGALADFAPLGVTPESGPKALTLRPEEIDRALRASEGVNVLNSPRILSRPLERATISVFDESLYVQDWKVETVVPGPKEIAVPLLGKLQVGQEITLRAAELAKGEITLRFALRRSSLVALRSSERRLEGAGNPIVEFTLPEIETTTLSADGLVANGGTLAFLARTLEGSQAAKDGRELLVLVTARLADDK